MSIAPEERDRWRTQAADEHIPRDKDGYPVGKLEHVAAAKEQDFGGYVKSARIICLLDALEAAEASKEKAERQLDSLRESIFNLVASSEGVAGLHYNGDIADWEWLRENGWLAWAEEEDGQYPPPTTTTNRRNDDYE